MFSNTLFLKSNDDQINDYDLKYIESRRNQLYEIDFE